ncbi:MAG: hypothetical protein AAF959_20230 [Cyanobacteria bacterium P01_D01_bin.56]
MLWSIGNDDDLENKLNRFPKVIVGKGRVAIFFEFGGASSGVVLVYYLEALRPLAEYSCLKKTANRALGYPGVLWL